MTALEALFCALLARAGHDAEIAARVDTDRAWVRAATIGRAADALAYAARPVLARAGWRSRGVGIAFWGAR